MNNLAGLTFEQRITLQLGELILEVKRLETLRDQMDSQIKSLEIDAQKRGIRSVLGASDSPST